MIFNMKKLWNELYYLAFLFFGFECKKKRRKKSISIEKSSAKKSHEEHWVYTMKNKKKIETELFMHYSILIFFFLLHFEAFEHFFLSFLSELHKKMNWIWIAITILNQYANETTREISLNRIWVQLNKRCTVMTTTTIELNSKVQQNDFLQVAKNMFSSRQKSKKRKIQSQSESYYTCNREITMNKQA